MREEFFSQCQRYLRILGRFVFESLEGKWDNPKDFGGREGVTFPWVGYAEGSERL
jgi:hypothetical protein